MSLETETQVDQIKRVENEDGNSVPPANAEIQGNRDTLEGFTHSTSGTDPEPLPSHAVPDGVAVFVHPLSTNADVVRIGPEGAVTYPLASSDAAYTTQVSDTSALYVKTPNSGDGVAVHWEADA